MEWILLEKEEPYKEGMYLVSYMSGDNLVTYIGDWKYTLVLVKEDHDEAYCKKKWSFDNPGVIWWAYLPLPPK